MSFGGGQSTQRSFSSIGGDQSGNNMFNKQPQTSNVFSSNMFGGNSNQGGNLFAQGNSNQSQTNPFGGVKPSGQSMFAQQNPPQNAFGHMGQNNPGSLFGQNQGNQGGGTFLNAQGGGTNFLQNMGNNPTQPPPAGNSNLMAMRK